MYRLRFSLLCSRSRSSTLAHARMRSSTQQPTAWMSPSSADTSTPTRLSVLQRSRQWRHLWAPTSHTISRLASCTFVRARGNYRRGLLPLLNTAALWPSRKSDLRRNFHPYADFLFGAGHIFFTQPPAPGYRSDKSVVYSYGGGMDFDVHGNFAAKIDFQAQSWNWALKSLGHRQPGAQPSRWYPSPSWSA